MLIQDYKGHRHNHKGHRHKEARRTKKKSVKPPRMGKARRTKKHKTKEEETTKITREKQKRKQDEVLDFSHSDSTTNLNTQSEEFWECPPSSKKHVIPDSTKKSSSRRLASLRSSKRLKETGITSLSRCSQPDLRHEEETAKVGNSIAKKENLLGVDTLEAEMNMEEVGEAENGVGLRPSPSFSLRLTELVNMVEEDDDDDDDDEVYSVPLSCFPINTVEGYKVKPESMAILRKVLTRHGDIAKNCSAMTMQCRSGLLEMICGIISDLQGKDLRQIKEDFLHTNIALVNDIKNMQVDIEWLHTRLVEMLEAKKVNEQCALLKEEKERNRKTIEDAESKLEECEERKKEFEERKKELAALKKELAGLFKSVCDEESVSKEILARAKDKSTRITERIKDATSKVNRFLNCSPVDDLL